jgi:zinc-ribbon domain
MTICPKCGAQLQPDWRFCMNCSSPVEPVPTPIPTPSPALAPAAPETRTPAGASSTGAEQAMQRSPLRSKFLVLRIVVDLLKVMAVIEVAGGLLFGIVLASSKPSPQPFGAIGGGILDVVGPGGFLVALIFGFFGGLYTWATADMISVALAIEENTRALRLNIR